MGGEWQEAVRLALRHLPEVPAANYGWARPLAEAAAANPGAGLTAQALVRTLQRLAASGL